jgi:hypothetical protein
MPLDMQHAKSAFQGDTGLEPTRCSETQITTASVQYLRKFIHKKTKYYKYIVIILAHLT